MTFKVAIYFAGPMTKWSGKLQDEEVIARHRYPWLWLARWVGRSTMKNLNANRCGYAIFRGSELIESHNQ